MKILDDPPLQIGTRVNCDLPSGATGTVLGTSEIMAFIRLDDLAVAFDQIEIITDPQPEKRCSFCSKSQGNVRWLVAGPVALICDECITVATEIVAEQNAQTQPPQTPTRKRKQKTKVKAKAK